jgi:Spy/CpxP family protein refolding chaperone
MGGGSPFGGAGTMGGGAFPQAQNPRTGPPPASNDIQSTMRGGLQLGPPGRWWDDGKFAKSLGLDSRQQQRMDEVFSANKGTLLKLFKSLQHEESQLDKTTRVRNPDEAQIFQQIDRVTSARGEVEKAYAHMELEIRKEMTSEQIGRLEDHRPALQ